MQMRHVLPAVILGVLSLTIGVADGHAQDSNAEMEDFLLTADVGETQFLSTGVTGAMRATLTKGGQTHDAQIPERPSRCAMTHCS